MAQCPIYVAVLLFLASFAQAETLVESSVVTQVLDGDTSYRVNAGTNISVGWGDAVVVNGTAPVSFSNAGTILSYVRARNAGLVLHATGRFINETTGMVSGNSYGVRMIGGGNGNDVVNHGDISGFTSHAVYYGGTSSGVLDNYGTLNAGGAAAIATLTNGVFLQTTGDITINNRPGASIRSGVGHAVFGGGIIVETGSATINNDGLIAGYHAGIDSLTAGAVQVNNREMGTLRADQGPAVRLQQNSGIINHGVIDSTGGAAILLSGGNNNVVLGTGSALNGAGNAVIVSRGTGNTLTLAGNGSEDGDILAQAGGGLALLTADAGSKWVLDGNVNLGGDTAGTLLVLGDLTLGGTVDHERGGTMIGDGGSLTLGHGGASGIVDGDIVNNGSLTFHRGDDVDFSGVVGGKGSLTKTGQGALQLSQANSYTGATLINEGTLQGGTADVVAASSQVTIGHAARFDLNGFDQTANNLSGTGSVTLGSATLTAQSTADTVFGGSISGSGAVNKTGTAMLSLGNDSHYTGATGVNAGALILRNGARLLNTLQVTVASDAVFGGYGTVGGSINNHGVLAVADAAPGLAASPAGEFVVGGALVNSGEVRMSGSVPANTLTVHGNYTGAQGRLTMATALGNDGSATDRLVVHGNTAGETSINVRNAGGAGARTQQGIRIVQVDGQSDGVFSLEGRVVAGVYEYGLYKGGATMNDGNWYLHTPSDAPPRPETGAYLANQLAAQRMFVHTLHDRTGFSDPRSADGATRQASNGWVRVIGGHADGNAANGALRQSIDSAVVHGGVELLNRVYGRHRYQAGLMAGYGTASTHSSAPGNPAIARGGVDGGSGGIYGTWRGNAANADGPYVDTWVQYGHFRNTLNSTGLRAESYTNSSWTGSLEAGWAFPLGRTGLGVVQLEPQLQLIYTDYRAASRREHNGTLVASQGGDRLTTRLGTRLFHAPDPGSRPAWLPYAELNWWHDTSRDAMAFDGVVVAQDGPSDRVEVKVGWQGQLAENWRMWGDIAYQYGNGGHESIAGMLGARYLW